MGVGPLEIEPSFTGSTPPGLINADTWGELAVSVAVSEKLLPERKWPSSAVVDIISLFVGEEGRGMVGVSTHWISYSLASLRRLTGRTFGVNYQLIYSRRRRLWEYSHT